MKHALWIWRKEAAEKNSTARFRKAFSLPEIPRAAVLTVSAHHYFKLRVNGTPVGGLVSPASSVFQKHKLLLHYDVTHLLRKGENVLAFTVLYLGGNGQNRTRGCAGLLLPKTRPTAPCASPWRGAWTPTPPPSWRRS